MDLPSTTSRESQQAPKASKPGAAVEDRLSRSSNRKQRSATKKPPEASQKPSDESKPGAEQGPHRRKTSATPSTVSLLPPPGEEGREREAQQTSSSLSGAGTSAAASAAPKILSSTPKTKTDTPKSVHIVDDAREPSPGQSASKSRRQTGTADNTPASPSQAKDAGQTAGKRPDPPDVKVFVRDTKAAKSSSHSRKAGASKKDKRVDEEGLHDLLTSLPTMGSSSSTVRHANPAPQLTRLQRERLLTALEGLACLIFVVMLSIFFFYGVTRRKPLCRSDVCRSYAKLLMEMLNVSADPCEDFYSYVCSRWHAHHFYTFKEGIYLKFIERVSDRNRHTAVPAQGQSAVQKAAQFYQSCSQIYTTGGERELSTVKRLLADFGVFWPRLSNASNLLRNCFAMSAALDWAPIILFSLARPGHIVVTPAPFYAFLLGRRRATLSSGSDGREYRSYFTHMVDTFGQPGSSSGVLSYDELLAVESQVVPVLQQAHAAADGGIMKNGTFDDLLNLAGEAIPRSTWEEQLVENFKHDGPNQTAALRFAIENVLFFVEFFALVGNLSESRMAYYVGWATVQGLSLLTKPDIINFYYPSRSEAVQGHVLACAGLSHHYMGLAFYANYIREEFTAHEVADVTDLVSHVRKFFSEGFSSSGALKKFIDESLPSPSAASAPLKFISDSQERQLDGLFEHFPDMKPNIFDNVESVAAARRMTPADTRTATFRWNGTVRFYYLTEEERFELLPIALEPPFYSSEAPPAVKYGALGAEIGDAMAGIVSRRLRDADEDTRAKIYAEVLCQRNPSALPVQTTASPSPGWPHISRRELAERVVSLNTAFKAFLAATGGGNQYRLEGYESVTGKRMFFILWCMAQCGASDGKHKCNDPLGFFRHFAKAFECKVGSAMFTMSDCP